MAKGDEKHLSMLSLSTEGFYEFCLIYLDGLDKMNLSEILYITVSLSELN